MNNVSIYMHGRCGDFAIALHDVIGWPIKAVIEDDNVFDGATGGAAHHWVVQAPDGRYLDAEGWKTEEDLLNSYGFLADEGQTIVLARTTRDDVWEWVYNMGRDVTDLATALHDARKLLNELQIQGN